MTSPPPKTINYIQLLSACYSAAQQSAHIIVDTLAQGRNGCFNNKGATADVYDPQTVADIGAQHIIQSGLRALYPGIQIVGEEPESSVEDYIKNFDVAPIPLLDANLFTSTPTQLTYLDNNQTKLGDLPVISTAFLPPFLAEMDFSKVIIFIDPLDGTSEYTKGHKEHVTTLISIAYDQHAIGGVLYYPFTTECLFGGVGLGCYSSNAIHLAPQRVNNQYEAIKRHPFFSTLCAEWLKDKSTLELFEAAQGKNTTQNLLDSKDRRVVTSKSHFSKSILDYFDTIGIDFNSEVSSMGGAGNKGAKVLSGVATAYLYPVGGTNRWDIGVLEGLLWAHGGSLTDVYGKLYLYGLTDKVNANGTICSLGNDHSQFILTEAPL